MDLLGDVTQAVECKDAYFTFDASDDDNISEAAFTKPKTANSVAGRAYKELAATLKHARDEDSGRTTRLSKQFKNMLAKAQQPASRAPNELEYPSTGLLTPIVRPGSGTSPSDELDYICMTFKLASF